MRDMKRFFVHALLICALVAGMGNACAWEDPIGDIYPKVIAKDGVFVVESRKDSQKIVDGEVCSRTDFYIIRTFDPDGKLLSERKETFPTPILYKNRFPHPEHILNKHHGLDLTDEYGTLWIVPYHHSGDKENDIFPVISLRDGQYTYHPVKLKNNRYMRIDGAIVDEKKLYLFVLGPFDKTKEEYEFTLHKISLESFSELASMQIFVTNFENPSHCNSEMLLHEGKMHIAFLKKRYGGWLGFEVVLLSWDGLSSQCRRRVLTPLVDWNTSFSLTNIGDKALLTWHYPDSPFFYTEKFIPQARVHTLAFSLASDASAWCIVHDFFYWLPLLLALAWPVIAVLRGGRVWLYALISYPLLVISYFLLGAIFPVALIWAGLNEVAQELVALVPAAHFIPAAILFGWAISIPAVIATWLASYCARWGRRKFL